MDSLLAHLSHRFVTQEENLATEALAYLLSTHDAAAKAMLRFVNGFGVDLPDRLRFQTQPRSANDGSIPDLVGSGPDGKTPLICEVKFWAGLTANQPVAYFQQLPDDQPTLLLFLAPEKRRAALWAELITRMSQAGIAHDGVATADRCVATHGTRSLALTTWPRLLDVLEAGLHDPVNAAGLADLRQLRGLTERMDAEAFLPLTSEELTGDIGQRLLGLGNALNDAVTELVALGVVDTKGLRAASTFAWFGRWIHIGSLSCLLRVSYAAWGSMAPTPVWLRIGDTKAGEVREALASLAHANPSRLILRPEVCHVPIHLQVGDDLLTTRSRIVKAVTEVRDLLRPVEAGAEQIVEGDDAVALDSPD